MGNAVKILGKMTAFAELLLGHTAEGLPIYRLFQHRTGVSENEQQFDGYYVILCGRGVDAGRY